jgi:hypothetical protein
VDQAASSTSSPFISGWPTITAALSAAATRVALHRAMKRLSDAAERMMK